MNDDVTETFKIISGMVTTMMEAYAAEMRALGVDDLDIAIAHLRVNRAMETWTEANFPD